MTQLLTACGYGVTFLLLAFEDEWAWNHDPDLLAEMRAAWDDVIVVHAGDHVGRPPSGGTAHQLDEWWDNTLQTTLANLATRRFFDVVVVHNVWLTKAFDFVHPGATKVLETHDLFWKRPDAFARLGLPPAFFVTDRASELFGLARADIVVTIQSAEARELLELTPRRVVNVPFYDGALHDAADPAPAAFAHAEKVSFGFLASANPFNIHGVNALLAALEHEIGENFAPVEIVVGGMVGQHIRTSLPIKRLGRVATERGFYAGVDYAIAPVFEGTGFKIKTADALALARPLLASTHAADGTGLDASLVCESAAEMARRMAGIALRRSDPGRAQTHVRRARDRLRMQTADGEANLMRAIAIARSPLTIDLRHVSAETAPGAWLLQSWLGVVRVLGERRPVLLVLPQSARLRLAKLLPPGVRAIAAGETDACRAFWPRCVEIDAACVASPPPHPNLLWEGAALRARAIWAETRDGTEALNDRASLLILRSGPPARFRAHCETAIIDTTDGAAVARTLLRLLVAPPPGAEIVCAAAPPVVRQAFLDVCALRGLPFHGMVDDAALAPARLPATQGELARRARDAAHALTLSPDSRSGTRETSCLAA